MEDGWTWVVYTVLLEIGESLATALMYTLFWHVQLSILSTARSAPPPLSQPYKKHAQCSRIIGVRLSYQLPRQSDEVVEVTR